MVNRETFEHLPSLTEAESPTSSRMDGTASGMSPIKISEDPNIVILRQVQEHPEDVRPSSPPIALRTAIKVENENKTLDEATRVANNPSVQQSDSVGLSVCSQSVY